MAKHINYSAMILICIISSYNIGYSQPHYKVKNSKEVDMKLSGTSSMHDWEMEASSASGEAQFMFKPGHEGELVSIKSLSFALEVENLKGEKSGLNKNAYEALKSDKYKEICYKLGSSTVSAEKGGYLVKSKGNLTIAGFTNEITMDVHCVVNDNGSITSKGSYQLNMTDYQVEPPSFMWGVMKTGDAVTLDFVVVYEK